MIHPLALSYLEAAKSGKPTYAAYEAWEAAGCPIHAEPPPNTVRVRVAVVADADRNWGASGCSFDRDNCSQADSDLFDEESARDHEHIADDARLTWGILYVPLPEPAAEVVGEVEG